MNKAPFVRALRAVSLASFLMGCVAVPSFAGNVSLNLSGWNADLIAEKTALSPVAGTSVGFSGLDWYETGAPNTTLGLPSSGSFTSAYNSNTAFQFQAFSGSNAVLNSGTLALTNPGNYSTLAFLTSAQGGGQSFQIVVHFLGGATTTLTGTDPDWTQTGNNALTNTGLVYRDTSWAPTDNFTAATISMFEHDYTLSTTDQARVITSIDFTKTAGGAEALFAVSGSLTPTPEPTSLALIGGGLLLFGVVRKVRS